MAKLKVFSGMSYPGGKQTKTIVAATSQKKAAELAGVSLNYLREHWSVTGNAAQIRVATSKPGTVFYGEDRWGNEQWIERFTGVIHTVTPA
jgi:hypothetical protein